MNLEIIKQKINSETKIETLREMAMLLTKCIKTDSNGSGYCVVNDHNPPYSMYSGTRENCVAFIEGYDIATNYGLDPSVNCVCVDTPSRMIVIPEERFGESLGGD